MENITKTQFFDAFRNSKKVYFVSSDFTQNDILQLSNIIDLIKKQSVTNEDLRIFKRSTTTRIYFDNDSYIDFTQICKSRKFVKFENYYIFQELYQDDYNKTEKNPNGIKYLTMIYQIY